MLSPYCSHDKILKTQLIRPFLMVQWLRIHLPEDLNRHFSKEDTRWLINMWKHTQHHSLLEESKSKPQWDSTSHQSEWSSSKNPQTIHIGEGMEKREPSYTVGGNVNWYCHYWRQYGDAFKKKKKNLGIKLPYDSAIPLLGIYPEETKIERDTCTQMFIAALFIIARTWK